MNYMSFFILEFCWSLIAYYVFLGFHNGLHTWISPPLRNARAILKFLFKQGLLFFMTSARYGDSCEMIGSRSVDSWARDCYAWLDMRVFRYHELLTRHSAHLNYMVDFWYRLLLSREEVWDFLETSGMVHYLNTQKDSRCALFTEGT